MGTRNLLWLAAAGALLVGVSLVGEVFLPMPPIAASMYPAKCGPVARSVPAILCRRRGPIMTDTLPRQAWMAHPATVLVMSALAAAGGSDAARFVGGCVRNALIGATVNDITSPPLSSLPR